MQPDFHINEPKSGEKLKAAWGANVVKSINALQPSVGYGLRISRNLNGVLYELDQGISGKSKGFDMPFDFFFDHYDESESKVYLKVKHGQVFYNLGTSTTEIKAKTDSEEEIISVGNITPTHDVNSTLGLVFNYSDSNTGDGSFAPGSWTIDALPDPEDEAYSDLVGIKYYPLFRLKSNNEPEEHGPEWQGDDKYPVKFTFDIRNENDDKNHILGIQLYHGNVWLSYSDGACFIAEVGGESQIGEYTASILDFGSDSGTYDTVRVNVTELAYNDALPSSSRVIVHPVFVLAYDSDSTSGGD